jgi:hypothetical protein
MSRIIYPLQFLQQVILLGTIKAKHVADGLTSVIKTFLTQHTIDLVADETAGTSATTHETARALLSRQSENYRELRDTKFKPVMQHLRKCAQNLKSFYSPNVHELGNWGFTIDGSGRIVYPSDFIGQFNLFKTFKAKSDTLAGSANPLTNFYTQQSINLSNDDTAADAAHTYNTQFISATENAENETELRDNLWSAPNEHIHMISDYLKKSFPDNAKKLGEWGITVDDSPRAPKERISNINPASTVKITGITIGGTLTNIGGTDLHLYKGKSTEGTPIIVHPNEMIGMVKGYSTITVVDPSTTEPGKLKVLRSK